MAFEITPSAHTGAVHLRVADLGRALAFYVELLGFHADARDGATVALSAAPEAPRLIVLTEVPGAVAPHRTTGLYHVAIRVPSAPALGSLLARLLAADYPLQGASDHPTNKAIYLADPDGNGIELTIDNPRDQWFDQEGHMRMESPPLDGQALLAAAGPAPWPGIDPRADIGHVHLHVSDLDRAVAFYRDAIGLGVQFYLPSLRAVFLSAGGYHHHLGLNTWNGRGAPRPANNAVGLVSFTLAVPAKSDIAAVVANAASRGVHPVEPPNGTATFADPDGNYIVFASSNG